MSLSSKRTLLIISSLFMILIGVGLVSLLVFKRGSEHHQGKRTKHEHPAATTGSEVKFQAPQGYDLNSIYQTIAADCSKNPSCFHKTLIRITETYGPAASLESLRRLQENGQISLATDDHHLAHEIGIKTAERFGINGQAFLLCPTSFNYGCQHGFFQYALGKAGSTEKAARAICSSLDHSYSGKFKFYCYHGLGHGVMMARDYDLREALATCDTIGSAFGQEGCWQGVFMENVNAAMRGDQRASTFSKSDPLAPCNGVQEKYRHECFINHAGWLMNFFRNDLTKATSACLQAPNSHTSSCLQSIGLMVTNPAWQPSLSKSSGKKKFEEVAWNLCIKFPKDHQGQCVIGAVDNILNFGELVVLRARNFCNTVNPAYKNLCYRRIGISLRTQTTDPKVVREKCATFEDPFKEECLRGASL
ncbi:MAG: hypothetical protein ACREQA_13220 [Candidatus Binatia bacterium]